MLVLPYSCASIMLKEGGSHRAEQEHSCARKSSMGTSEKRRAWAERRLDEEKNLKAMRTKVDLRDGDE